MDVTMDIEVEHQITQPESQLTVMETCYKEPTLEETYTTDEVQTRSQTQKKVNIIKEVSLSSRSISFWDRRTSREIKAIINQVMDQVTSLSTTKGTTKVVVTSPSTRDNNSLHQIKHLCNSLESTLAWYYLQSLGWNNSSR